MPRKRRKRTPRATDGGSAVAVLARLGRPGGRHGRRKPARGPAKRKAIQDAGDRA